MYTNPHNIIRTLICMLDRNAIDITRCIEIFEERQLTIFEGMRKTLPADMFPSFEIEPTTASDQWATTRAQRPQYNFQCVLTVINANEDFGVEYIATVATRLMSLMTDPQNLQAQILNETKWDPNGGLVASFYLDSLVDSVSFNASKDGSIRTVEFDWWVKVHEPYPESKWLHGNANQPAILKPKVIEL